MKKLSNTLIFSLLNKLSHIEHKIFSNFVEGATYLTVDTILGKGNTLALINKEKTDYDQMASICINKDIIDVVEELYKL